VGEVGIQLLNKINGRDTLESLKEDQKAQ
jgi:hypothetical protein